MHIARMSKADAIDQVVWHAALIDKGCQQRLWHHIGRDGRAAFVVINDTRCGCGYGDREEERDGAVGVGGTAVSH